MRELFGYLILIVAAFVGWSFFVDHGQAWRKLTGTETYEDKLESLRDHIEGNRIGVSTDYWLIKASSLAGNDRVGLVFGFLDDAEFCWEIAELYMSRYPGDRYVCSPAN